MIKYILILTSVFALQSHALQFDVVKRGVAQEDLTAEKELLIGIATCVKEKTPEDMVKCARPLMSEKLNERQIRKILFWFAQDTKLTSFGVCSKSTTEFIPERVKLDSKKIVCGGYSVEGLEKQAVFFIGSDSANKLRLVNLRP